PQVCNERSPTAQLRLASLELPAEAPKGLSDQADVQEPPAAAKGSSCWFLCGGAPCGLGRVEGTGPAQRPHGPGDELRPPRAREPRSRGRPGGSGRGPKSARAVLR
ncbi:unnamed protein product, partial [Prorocentrum cordatum]